MKAKKMCRLSVVKMDGDTLISGCSACNYGHLSSSISLYLQGKQSLLELKKC
ncbi:MAG: hypothetical protein Q4F47_06920 [Bacteroidaceae bacterium]|nr:hypothetical protein [Bacteroidaceae bacterium]MDO5482753.1 hypothetical protein [Bacteroidaceae bacterium]